MNSKSRIISTDEDPSLRIESSAIINLRGVATKLNKYMFSKATSESSSRKLEELGHNKVAPRSHRNNVLVSKTSFNFCIHFFLQFRTRLEQIHRNPLVRDFLCRKIAGTYNFHLLFEILWKTAIGKFLRDQNTMVQLFGSLNHAYPFIGILTMVQM